MHFCMHSNLNISRPILVPRSSNHVKFMAMVTLVTASVNKNADKTKDCSPWLATLVVTMPSRGPARSAKGTSHRDVVMLKSCLLTSSEAFALLSKAKLLEEAEGLRDSKAWSP
eukprot:GFUD01056923.1.p1 GENE.GFUD01056923.1~~GFUD01056923.1.p1  ORF type:complete len:113 (-),score=2.54 GFUD01056923.1:19-357(-)